MNKKEAAEYLGFSVANLQRLMNSNKITYKKIKGKYGPEADFEKEDLDAYKANLEKALEEGKANPVISPVVSVLATENLNSNSPNSPNSPSIKDSIIAINTDDFMRIVKKFAQATNKENKQLAGSTIDLSKQLLLSIKEASIFVGLTVATIRGLIKKGDLKGVKLGRGQKLKREDLEIWVKGL